MSDHDPVTCHREPCPDCAACPMDWPVVAVVEPDWGHPDGSVDFNDVDLDAQQWLLEVRGS